MRQTSANARAAGALLAIGGILFFIAGVLHPHSMAVAARLSVLSMLASPLWIAAHWVSYISIVLIILAIWLLLDEPGRRALSWPASAHGLPSSAVFS